MTQRARRSTVLALVALVASAAPPAGHAADPRCLPGEPTETVVATPRVTSKAFDQAVQGLAARRGLITIFPDPKKPRILAALRQDGATGELGTFLYQVSLRTGLGSTPLGLDRAQIADTQIVTFRRVGQTVLAELLNTGFRAAQGSADEKRAVRESFPSATIWSTAVLADRAGEVLFDLSGFLTRDAFGVIDTLAQSTKGSFKLDAALSYPDVDPGTLLVLPRNVELEAHQTFSSDAAAAPEIAGILPRGQTDPSPAPHTVSLVVHHSLVKLPDPGFVPRRGDPRVGGIDETVTDYAVSLGTPLMSHLAHRFRLEKTDPAAARSPVKQPICFFVDPAAPEPVRSALIDGARWWADAFEAAGFENAFVVDVLPPGASPLDIRYNVINWVHRQTRGWSYGENVVDPRTGEIVKGAVRLGSQRVRQDRMIFEGLVGAAKTGSGAPDDPIRIALARLRQLAVHETGHALGLEHNFAGSSFDDRASVMDYPAPRIRIVGDTFDFTDAYKVGIGSWDRLSIRWLYHQAVPGADEAPVLDALIRDGYAHGMRFVADVDARPPGSSQPHGALWDDGDDPVTELGHVLEVRRLALARFGPDDLPRGTPQSELRRVLVPIYLFHRYEVDAVAKSIGGSDFSYAVAGGGMAASTPVAGSAQRRALDALLATLEPGVLDLPEETLAQLSAGEFSSPDRQSVIEVFGVPDSEPFELSPADAVTRRPPFSLTAAATAAADITLGDLLEVSRVNRVAEQGALTDGQLGLPEMLSQSIQRIFAVPGDSRPHRAALRRVVESRLLLRLARLADDKRLSAAAAIDLRAALKDLGARLDAVKKGDPADIAAARYYADLLLHDRLAELAKTAHQAAIPTGPPVGAGGEDDWFSGS